ncbi:MAG: OB-fold domain-containing protein [Deltaproteobacteria bacterium]|nr:OB-fold domain-containing protein [Deltaproteobacteria bacterium]
MIGITSIGAYIPMYRLQREEIARMWGTQGIGGEKAVAGYDEDSITMAVAAVRECRRRCAGSAEGLYFASTTAPYREKQSAAIIASVAGLDRACVTADFANSLRSGTTALKAAHDAIKSGSNSQVLVTASDCRLGMPKGRFEQLFGDAAAAVSIGSEGVIAEIEACYSLCSDFIDVWRTASDRFAHSGEGRFINDEGYFPIMQEGISGTMKAHSLNPDDFSKIVFTASDARQHADLAKKLRFDSSQVQSPFFSEIGHVGTAGTLVMLIAALEEAKPGDRILLANYGDGVDTFILTATKSITDFPFKPLIEDQLKNARSIDYGTYLSWRDLMPLDTENLPPRNALSLSSRWRERKIISTLTGVKCRKCGTPQIHTIGQNIRICVQCQSKDNFDEYRFSDKKATLFTYAIDHLQPTKNPPGLNGAIDFEEGGRLLCELTDYDLDKVEIGMPVEMTFRKMTLDDDFINYFWKAKPIVD